MASFSGSDIILYAMAHRLEGMGHEIIQFAFIDHFPPLWFCPILSADPRTCDYFASNIRKLFLEANFTGLARVTCRDGGGGNPRRIKAARDLTLGYMGLSAPRLPRSHISSWDALEVFVLAVLDYVLYLSREHKGIQTQPKDLFEVLGSWMREVKATPTLYVASYGMIGVLPPELKNEWGDMGARALVGNVDVVELNAGHYDILLHKDLIQHLQTGFQIASKL